MNPAGMPLIVGFLVTFLSAPVLRRLALRFDIVDAPAARKLQKAPVPLLGGAAVFLGILAGALPVAHADPVMAALFSGAGVIFVVSLLDDVTPLSARFRLFIQWVAATLLIVNDLKISFLPNTGWGNALEIVITYLWIIGITNAFNYLDGVDALCSSLAALASLFFILVLAGNGQQKLIFLCLSVLGACLGFIPHNLRRVKMFLGDSGSMMLGYLLAGISLIGNFAEGDILKITVPILILGVPIFDMVFTTIMRVKEKKVRTIVEWFEYAGRDHFHHYLMDLGLMRGGTVGFICLVAITLGLSAYLISRSSNDFDGYLMIIKSAIIFILIAVLMVLGRRLHREEEVRDRVGI